MRFRPLGIRCRYVCHCLILLASLQSIILRIFSPKNRTLLPYFKKSLKKVQSIHCLDDPFCCTKNVFIFCYVFDFFFWFLFRASFYAFLAQKTAPFCLISKSHWKQYSLYTVWMTLFVLKKFFYFLLCFWFLFVGFSSDQYSTHF